jgi:hypothetical protein
MAVASSPLAFAVHQKPQRHSASVSVANVSLASSLVTSVDLPAVSVPVRHGSRQRCRCAATPEDGEPSTSGNVSEAEETAAPETGARGENGAAGVRRRRGDPPRTADSTDWISSSLTRRFGLGAGLAWVGVLAFGVISEQIKTRNEVFLEAQGTR